MTFEDHCGECGAILDVTRRIYRGPGGKPRCPVCAVLAECEASIAQARLILELAAKGLEEDHKERRSN